MPYYFQWPEWEKTDIFFGEMRERWWRRKGRLGSMWPENANKKTIIGGSEPGWKLGGETLVNLKTEERPGQKGRDHRPNYNIEEGSKIRKGGDCKGSQDSFRQGKNGQQFRVKRQREVGCIWFGEEKKWGGKSSPMRNKKRGTDHLPLKKKKKEGSS